MALPDPRIVSINELRFRPANSNDRARAGLDHAFRDVPPCSFARDDGISPYMGSDAGIDSFPDAPRDQPALHDDVPHVAHEAARPSAFFAHKILRDGFALSVFINVMAVVAIGYYTTVSLPDDALLAGETVISLELISDSEVDSVSAGAEEAVEEPEEKPVVEPEKIEEPEKVEEPPVKEPLVKEPPPEEARLPEPVEEPVEPTEPVVTTEEPEVLATDRPSSFAVEQAVRTILDTTEIEPLPQILPDELVAPPVEEKPEPKLAQPLPHPISKPRVVRKVAETKPVETKVEPKPVEKKPVEKKPEPKKEEPKPAKKVEDKAPEKKKPVEKPKKDKGNKGDTESDSKRGTTNPKNKGKQNQDASEGGRKNRDSGNSSVSNYKGLVQRKLERAKQRVRVAGKGKVVVSFTISANGSVVNLRIRTSSGKPAVDKGALDVIRKASPFPAIPAEAGRSSWPMSVPMTFRGN